MEHPYKCAFTNTLASLQTKTLHIQQLTKVKCPARGTLPQNRAENERKKPKGGRYLSQYTSTKTSTTEEKSQQIMLRTKPEQCDCYSVDFILHIDFFEEVVKKKSFFFCSWVAVILFHTYVEQRAPAWADLNKQYLTQSEWNVLKNYLPWTHKLLESSASE